MDSFAKIQVDAKERKLKRLVDVSVEGQGGMHKDEEWTDRGKSVTMQIEEVRDYQGFK